MESKLIEGFCKDCGIPVKTTQELYELSDKICQRCKPFKNGDIFKDYKIVFKFLKEEWFELKYSMDEIKALFKRDNYNSIIKVDDSNNCYLSVYYFNNIDHYVSAYSQEDKVSLIKAVKEYFRIDVNYFNIDIGTHSIWSSVFPTLQWKHGIHNNSSIVELFNYFLQNGILDQREYIGYLNKIKFTGVFVKKLSDSAIIPSKKIESDVGYDISVIDIDEKVSDDLTIYKTGLIVVPPKGYYLQIYGRSSLCKSGYMLANSVAIIDPNYRGEIKIPLLKIDKAAKPIEYPFRCCQFVICKKTDMDFLEVLRVDSTDRGERGFGEGTK